MLTSVQHEVCVTLASSGKWKATIDFHIFLSKSVFDGKKFAVKGWFDWSGNKTPGYLRDILRPPTLLKIRFRRMKTFSKYSVSSSYFLTFPTLNFLWFLPKNHKNEVERHFQEKIPFETHSRKKLPHVEILKSFKVFFRKNQSIFPKTQILNVLRFLIIPVTFYGKFATIEWK